MKAEIYEKLVSAASVHGAKIVSFSYYPEYFGDMVVTVDYHNSRFEFTTDRGEIYCNNEFVCDGSYHVAGKKDTIDKLIEVMQSILFDEQDNFGNPRA